MKYLHSDHVPLLELQPVFILKINKIVNIINLLE